MPEHNLDLEITEWRSVYVHKLDRLKNETNAARIRASHGNVGTTAIGPLAEDITKIEDKLIELRTKKHLEGATNG